MRPAVPPGPIVTLAYRSAPERRAALLDFFRGAFPFYERPGGIRMGLYQGADDPGLLLELVAYATEEDYVRDQVRVERDPEMLEVLGRFKTFLEGPVEVRRMRPVRVVRGAEVLPPAEPIAFNDHAAVAALLESAGLPLPGAEDAAVPMLVIRDGASIAGCAGWERHGEDALLRSVAVVQGARRRGIGRALVEAACSRSGASRIYLLTTGAADFFSRLGFAACDRTSVPDEVRASREFRLTCCASAVCMVREG